MSVLVSGSSSHHWPGFKLDSAQLKMEGKGVTNRRAASRQLPRLNVSVGSLCLNERKSMQRNQDEKRTPALSRPS
jgi:hypothetical protein